MGGSGDEASQTAPQLPVLPSSISGTDGEPEQQAELVCQAQNGDHGAFRQVISRHNSVLSALAYLMTRDQETAADIVQETLWRAWRALPNLRNSQSLRPWLVRILLNQARERARKRQLPYVPLDEMVREPVAVESVEGEVVSAEERATLWRAIQTLEPEHREVLILRYHLELSLNEIACTLNIRKGTVKSRLHRGIRRVRQALLNEGAGRPFEGAVRS